MIPQLEEVEVPTTTEHAPKPRALTSDQIRDALAAMRQRVEGDLAGRHRRESGVTDPAQIEDAVSNATIVALEQPDETFADVDHLRRWVVQTALNWLRNDWRDRGQHVRPISSLAYDDESADETADRISVQPLLEDVTDEELVPIRINRRKTIYPSPEALEEQVDQATSDPIIRAALLEHLKTRAKYEDLFVTYGQGKSFGKRAKSKQSFINLLKRARHAWYEIIRPTLAVPAPLLWRSSSEEWGFKRHSFGLERGVAYDAWGQLPLSVRLARWEAFVAPGVCKRVGPSKLCPCGNAKVWLEAGPTTAQDTKNAAMERVLDRIEDDRMTKNRIDFDLSGYGRDSR